MSNKIVTFGEIMLRLMPEGYYRFGQDQKYEATYGGGEANVAVSLSNFGEDAYFVSKVPAHDIGQCAINDLRKYGVNTSYVARGGERLGIYYIERGASQRPSKVIYDRAHSSISEASLSDFDWDEIFKDAKWFHFTGITPALSENATKLTIEACKQAKKHGVKISCDLNYRKKLWTKAQAQEVMTGLMQYVDVCIANEEDASDVFGITASDTDLNQGKVNHDSYKEVAKKLMDKFNFEYVAITLRESISASINNWSAMLYDGKDYHFSKKYSMQIIDRVGGGDSFGAGLIYSLVNGKSSADAIEFAVASSCLKHSIQGDYNRVSVSEVEALAGGNGSGRVQR